MTARYARLALLLALGLAPLRAVADETLAAAYSSILRGDYEAGRAAIEHILQTASDPQVARVRDWLDSYHQVIASRQELKAKSLEWNVQQAQKALSAGNLLLALSFTAQAVPYSDQPEELAKLDWVTQLTERCKEAAAQLEAEDRWTAAVNYYALLSRIHPTDEELRRLLEQATRYARIELAYPTQKAMQQRIRDVNKDLLRSAIKLIDHLYYREPDFKIMAEGALDNLTTLCKVTKLRGYLDGLANPALRDHFLRRLGELRAEMSGQSSFGYQDLRRLFNQVCDLNRESIEIPEGLLVVEFLEGALGRLDEYSGMIWPADAVDFEKMMMGGFEGVGIQLGVDERSNRLKVVTPLENSPALEAGIQPDDLIIAVNGESTAGWSTDDAVRNIMGPCGTEVVLTIQRPRTGDIISYKLIRRRIVLTTVRGVERLPGDAKAWNYMLDKDAGVAYIRLTGFHPDSAKELRAALRQAEAQGMKGLILDIRHNPGGLLDVAVEVVSLFVSDGEVVSTQGRLEPQKREKVSGRAPYPDLPLVVLVNEGSASASEILAGALQDHNRAIILGDRTFGKGSVQHVRPLSNEARLKLTTALYYLPNGRSPHKSPKAKTWGVDPDWELKLTPKEFRRVIERERETFIIHNEPEQGENRPLPESEQTKTLESPKTEENGSDQEPPLLSQEDLKALESDPSEAPKTDPQLETALLLIRIKLAADLPWPRKFAAAPQEQQR